MLMRWMTVTVLALGLSVVALEMSAGMAAERHALRDEVMNVGEPGLPTLGEAEFGGPSAPPHLTH
jgi:hypothetical protein